MRPRGKITLKPSDAIIRFYIKGVPNDSHVNLQREREGTRQPLQFSNNRKYYTGGSIAINSSRTGMINNVNSLVILARNSHDFGLAFKFVIALNCTR